jgi:hypothetical protein
MLHTILHGCEDFSLTLRKERRLRMFKKRALRRRFGPKEDYGVNGVMTGFIVFTHHDMFLA